MRRDSSSNGIAVAGVVAGLIVGYGFGQFGSRPTVARAAADPFRNVSASVLEENQELSMKVESLTNDLATYKTICSIDEVRERLRKEAAANPKTWIIDEQNKKDRDLVMKARSGSMGLTDLRKLLAGRDKGQVVGILGKPDKLHKPSSTSVNAVEVWVYSGKVTFEESGAKGALEIVFAGEEVMNVQAKGA